MRKIDEQKILDNINTMINTLEYDCMRSGGKTKINSNDLVNLITLKKHYENKNKQPVAKQPVAKQAANKKEA